MEVDRPTNIISTLADTSLRDELQQLRDILEGASLYSHAVQGNSRTQQEERLRALRRYRDVILSCFIGPGLDLSTRVPFQERAATCFKDPLLHLLSDVRANIVAAAAELIEVFFQHASFPSLVETLSNAFVKPLLRATANSVPRVRQAASAALQAILTNSFGSECFGAVVKAACAERHASVRSHALGAIAFALGRVKGTTPHRTVLKFLAPITGVVRRGLEDADPEVRHRAVVCFWGLSMQYPSTAEDILVTVSDTTRDHVFREQEVALGLMGAVPGTVLLSASQQETATATARRARHHSAQGSPVVPREGRVPHTVAGIEQELAAVAAKDARRVIQQPLQHPQLSKQSYWDPQPLLPPSPVNTTPRATNEKSSLLSVRRRGATGHSPRFSTRLNPPSPDAASSAPPADWEQVLSQLKSTSWIIRERGMKELQTMEQWKSCTQSGCAKSAFQMICLAVDDRIRRVQLHALASLKPLFVLLLPHQEDYLLHAPKKKEEGVVDTGQLSQFSSRHAELKDAVREFLPFLLTSLLHLTTTSPPTTREGNRSLSKVSSQQGLLVAWETLTILLLLFSPSTWVTAACTALREEVTWNPPHHRGRAAKLVPQRLTELLQFGMQEQHQRLSSEEPQWWNKWVWPSLQAGLQSLHQAPTTGPSTAVRSPEAPWRTALGAAFVTGYKVCRPSLTTKALASTSLETQHALGVCIGMQCPSLAAWCVAQPHPHRNDAPSRDAISFPSPSLLAQTLHQAMRRVHTSSFLSCPNALPNEEAALRAVDSATRRSRSDSHHVRRTAVDGSFFAYHDDHHHHHAVSCAAPLNLSETAARVRTPARTGASPTPRDGGAPSGWIPPQKRLFASAWGGCGNALSTTPFSTGAVIGGDVVPGSTSTASRVDALTSYGHSYDLLQKELQQTVRSAHPAPTTLDGGGEGDDSIVPQGSVPAILLQRLRDRTLPRHDKTLFLAQIRSHIQTDGQEWAVEPTLMSRLLRALQRLSAEEHEVHHVVRHQALCVLRAVLLSRSLQHSLSTACETLLSLCRTGMDDAFAEVQQEAAVCLHVVLHSAAIPADTRLNSLAACLEQWLQPPACFRCTVGWLELLNSVGRMFEERLHHRTESSHSTPPGRRSGSVAPREALTRGVLRRITGVLRGLMEHTVARVSTLATRSVVVMLWATQGATSMTEDLLTPAQRRLVDHCAQAIQRDAEAVGA